MKNAVLEEMVRSALASGKIRPDQEQWARDYANRDPGGFEIFVNKTIAVPPPLSIPPKEEIDATQRMVNALCGVDDETFSKHNSSSTEKHESADEIQQSINRLFGIKEPRRAMDKKDISETQRQINKLCGVDDEAFCKFNG